MCLTESRIAIDSSAIYLKTQTYQKDILGCHPSSTLLLRHKLMYGSFVSLVYPGISDILHCHAYASFLSWDIPSLSGMSAILHTTAESQVYLTFCPRISQDILGCQPASTLPLNPRVICPFCPGISQDILGCQLSSTLQLNPTVLCPFCPRISQDNPGMLVIIHTTVEFQAFVSFLSQDILGHPGMLAIIHTTVESQAFVSFLSQDILGHPGMSANLRTATKSQVYASFLSCDILQLPGVSAILYTVVESLPFLILQDIPGCQPSFTLKLMYLLSRDITVLSYWDISHPSHYSCHT